MYACIVCAYVVINLFLVITDCCLFKHFLLFCVCLVLNYHTFNLNFIHLHVTVVSKCSLYTFYNNPAPLNGSTQFHYCTITISNPGTGADDAFVLKRGVWRNATWPSHSRPAIAAEVRAIFKSVFLP